MQKKRLYSEKKTVQKDCTVKCMDENRKLTQYLPNHWYPFNPAKSADFLINLQIFDIFYYPPDDKMKIFSRGSQGMCRNYEFVHWRIVHWRIVRLLTDCPLTDCPVTILTDDKLSVTILKTCRVCQYKIF